MLGGPTVSSMDICILQGNPSKSLLAILHRLCNAKAPTRERGHLYRLIFAEQSFWFGPNMLQNRPQVLWLGFVGPKTTPNLPRFLGQQRKEKFTNGPLWGGQEQDAVARNEAESLIWYRIRKIPCFVSSCQGANVSHMVMVRVGQAYKCSSISSTLDKVERSRKVYLDYR